MNNNASASSATNAKEIKDEKTELQELWKELGIPPKDETVLSSQFNERESSRGSQLHPILAIGLGSAALLNIGILLSLPPVLRGRGAPYLPTFEKSLRAMFQQLRNEPRFLQQQQNIQRNHPTSASAAEKIVFVDLGSGDGRVVFRAARERLFTVCIGYEINPMLHAYALAQRFIFNLIQHPSSKTPTQFFLRDLWNVRLHNVNVVAVYGLAPIMVALGRKLQDELPHGSYVVSNVFAIPGWKPLHWSSSDNTYLYRTPDCWNKEHSATKNSKKSV